MSNDPVLNSALFDFCNRLNDGPTAGTPSSLPQRTPEDMAWLKQALSNFQAPDKILKKKLNVVSQCVPDSVCPKYEAPASPKPAAVAVAAKKPDDVADEGAAASTPVSTVGQPGLALLRHTETPVMLLAPPAASATPAPHQAPIAVTEEVKSQAATEEPVDNKKAQVTTSSKGAASTQPTSRGAHLTSYNADAACPVSGDDLLDSLEYLVEELEDINMALEACLMGMPHVMLGMLRIAEYDFEPSAAEGEGIKSNPALRNEEVRYNVAMALAHAVQQNTRVQQCFTALNWAEIAVPMLAKELVRFETGVAAGTPSSQASRSRGAVTMRTIAALLHFCSCMCRDNDEGTRDFIVHGGLDILTYTLTTVPPTVEGVRTQVTTTKTPAGELLEKTRHGGMWDRSITGSVKYVPILYLLSPKVVKRVLFLVDYLASVGISNSPLIRALCDLVGMVVLNGTEPEADIAAAATGSGVVGAVVSGQEYLQMLLPPSNSDKNTRMVLSAFPSAFAVAAAGRNALRSQFKETVISSGAPGAAPSTAQFDDEVEAKLETAADSFLLTSPIEVKGEIQGLICTCLLSLCARSQQVVSLMLKPRNVGKFAAKCYQECFRSAHQTIAGDSDPRLQLSAIMDA